MFKLIACLIFASPLFASAEVTREINGTKYYLNYDFDTADGECKLRGMDYAGSFYSFSDQIFPVAKLNADGTVKELIDNGTASYQVIDGISCE